MIPRLLLKVKKLDKYDFLDKEIKSVTKTRQNKCKIVHQFSSSFTQQDVKFNQLLKVLTFEWICGQKCVNKYYLKRNENNTINIDLHYFRYNVLLDLLLNSLFLTNGYKLSRNKLHYLVISVDIDSIMEFLLTYNLNKLFNINQFIFVIQILKINPISTKVF